MIPCCRRASSCVALAVVLLGAVLWLALLGGPAASDKAETPAPTRDGRHVEWEGWTFNWEMRRVEGLVLTHVHFRGRRVLNYAGIAEIFTPYDQGQPRPVDLSQNGLGEPPVPLVAGRDCSSGDWCKLFGAEGRETGGKAVPVVMMHEERTGPDYLGGFGRAPGKTLVLWAAGRFTGPPDGYTFLVRWKFQSDGTLIPEVGATGVPQHLRTGETSPTGALIGYNRQGKVFAPSHVHNFLYRLDFAVDGAENTVEEFNWEKDPTDAHKARCSWTPILKEAGRTCNPATFRSWRVVNPQSKNALGRPRSYQLLPAGSGLFRGAGTPSEKATEADLWVTRYRPEEWPRSATDARSALEALPHYVNSESVQNEHVVLWYWLCFHHFPRTEDWLHQPVVWKSFELMPRDFLDASPLKPDK